MTFLLYLCKVSLCAGILLGYYWLFLRNKRFHHYNRYYLMGTMIASVVLPFIKIKIWHQPQNPVNQVVYQTLDVLTVGYGETDGQLQGITPGEDLFTTDHLSFIVYAAGALALLVVLAKSLLYIRRIARRYPHEVIDRLKFYTTSEPGTPFSFFHSIFWNDQLSFNSKEGQQIFRHELFHIRQRHSNDVLLAELITALFWCNPFFYIIKKELKAIHEFLADQYAVSGSDRYAYAELLVMQTLQAPHMPVTHHFFQNHIKRRIAMITHLNAHQYNYWSRLMVLPVAVLLFCSFALYAQQPVVGSTGSNAELDNTPTKKALTVVIDAGHGGKDNGAVNADGLLEKDIALQISLKIQQLAPAYNVNVVMTRGDNELPTHATIKEDGLRARTTIAQQNKAAAFVSIHMSATENTDDARNGMEVYVARENEKWLDPSKQLGAAVLQSVSTLYTANPALLQRKEKGIWVLDHSPCPAILIECGYITDKEDVAFFSNSKNQETLAKKILEGIVSYQQQLTVSTTNEKTSVSQTTHTGTTAAPVFSHPPVVKQDTTKEPVTPEMLEAISILDNSKIVEKLSRFYNRNTRYPEKALMNNAERTFYFSIDVNKKGEYENLRLYQETPATTKKINELVTVGYPAGNNKVPTGLSAEESWKIFSEEVEGVFKRMPAITDVVIKETTTYYFKSSYHIERGKP